MVYFRSVDDLSSQEPPIYRSPNIQVILTDLIVVAYRKLRVQSGLETKIELKVDTNKGQYILKFLMPKEFIIRDLKRDIEDIEEIEA